MTTSRTSTRGAAGDSIFGRERELAQLYELVDGSHERGAALLVRGSAGIGKSTLLAAASRRAQQAGMRVLHASGFQSEAQLPFAGLHHLVLPVLDRADRLPSPQHTALFAAFGMAEEAPDRFLIALAVLELLSEAAERTPLLVIAEDAQWFDRSTADVLAFVARRVEHEPIVVLVASRDGEQSSIEAAGLPELRLGALADAAAGALLDAQSPDLTSAVRELLLAQAEGNPLALVELPRLLSKDELGGRSPLPAPLPLTERLERAFAFRATKLPPATSKLLLVAAANDGGVLSEILAAAATIHGEPSAEEAFAPAVAARLVEIDGTRIVFRHPLVRSAIYQRANVMERHAAHAAWAEVLTGMPDRRLWHRAASLVGPDEKVADALEEAATRAHRRGAISEAISTLRRAAQLSVDRIRRGQRLLDAAEVASELGRRDLALSLVDEAEQLGLDAVDRQRAMLIHEAFDTGEDAVRVWQVIEVAEQTWHRGSDFALNVLRRAAGKFWWVSRGEEERNVLAAAVDRMGLPEDNPQRLAILALVGSTEREAEVLDRLTSLVSEGGGDPVAARLLGLAGYAVGNFEFAVDALTVAITGLRGRGQLALLAQAIVTRAVAGAQLGRSDLAMTDAEEGFRLSVETAQPLFAEYARAAQSLLVGSRGDIDEAEAIAAEVERTMIPLHGKAVLWDVQLARGLTALGTGQYDAAYEHLIRTFDPNDPAEHYRKIYWAIGDLAEAALYSERRDEGRMVLERAEGEVGHTLSPRTRVALEYARPLLAEEDEAEKLFKAGLGTDLSRWPFARARMLLAYGTWLRHQRRVVESRPPLSAARVTFEALGASSWGERARLELRAAGVKSRPNKRSALDALTTQELQIARMAASGLTNREIGQQLYLSHRTVGAHLYRAFPKLGITSRGQLRDALGEAPDAASRDKFEDTRP